MEFRNPSINEKGLRVHLTELGVDYEQFVGDLEENIQLNGKPNVNRLHKKYGYSKVTILKWVRQYMEEKK